MQGKDCWAKPQGCANTSFYPNHTCTFLILQQAVAKLWVMFPRPSYFICPPMHIGSIFYAALQAPEQYGSIFRYAQMKRIYLLASLSAANSTQQYLRISCHNSELCSLKCLFRCYSIGISEGRTWEVQYLRPDFPTGSLRGRAAYSHFVFNAKTKEA